MDRRGVAGPFEDLPSLLVVIVATGLFMSVAARAAVMQHEAGEARERADRAWRLLEAALSLDCIASGEGVVDLRAARIATAEDLATALGWLEGGWRVNVSWEGGWLEWSSGVPSGERASAQASVVVDTGANMPGRMTAVVWDA